MIEESERTSIGRKILAAMEEAVAFANGDTTSGELSVVAVLEDVDVEALRESLNMTPEEFYAAYGVPSEALDGQPGNRQVQYYLRAIQNDPVGVFNAIHGTGTGKGQDR